MDEIFSGFLESLSLFSLEHTSNLSSSPSFRPLYFNVCAEVPDKMSTDPASVDTSFSLVKYNEPVLLPPDGTNG